MICRDMVGLECHENAVEHGLSLYHLDAERTFVQAKLDDATKNLGVTSRRGLGKKRCLRRLISVSVGAVFYGNAAISWFSRTRRCVLHSSWEFEYVAAASEAALLCKLFFMVEYVRLSSPLCLLAQVCFRRHPIASLIQKWSY